MSFDKSFFEKRFEEKRFVNVSICESNIKAKKGTFYGRVCKLGHINTKQILQIVKEKSPYIDVPMVESALEKIADVILDMVAQGYNVDFANLGTFSLSTQGKIEMYGGEASTNEQTEAPNEAGRVRPHTAGECSGDDTQNFQDMQQLQGNYDVSDKVKGGVNFAFKFSPSKALKASMKNIKMNLAISKKTAPLIESVEDALPERTSQSPYQRPQILRVKGKNLKILGDESQVGIYIEETREEDEMEHLIRGGIICDVTQKKVKVPASSLIQNEDKTLTFLLDERLKEDTQYCITVVTQGTSSGKIGKKLRCGRFNLCFEKIEKHVAK